MTLSKSTGTFQLCVRSMLLLMMIILVDGDYIRSMLLLMVIILDLCYLLMVIILDLCYC